MRRVVDPLVEFLREEAASGLAVLAGAVAALVWANVAGDGYAAFWARELGPLDLHHWVNDGLMAVFFLAVGIEIKHELTGGNLATPRQAALPALAATGGVFVPAGIYALIAWHDPVALQGWAIPAATDIAFAMGVIVRLGTERFCAFLPVDYGKAINTYRSFLLEPPSSIATTSSR